MVHYVGYNYWHVKCYNIMITFYYTIQYNIRAKWLILNKKFCPNFIMEGSKMQADQKKLTKF